MNLSEITLEQWTLIIPGILGALHFIASSIVAATPPPEDDIWLAKVVRFFRILSMAVGHAQPKQDLPPKKPKPRDNILQ